VTVRQLSVFVENKKGRLADVAEALASASVSIRALSLADDPDYGIVRLVVDQPDTALAVLRANGHTVKESEVIAVGAQDRPGSLARILRALAEANVDVDYMYATLVPGKPDVYVILRTHDNPSAMRALTASGVPILRADDVYRA